MINKITNSSEETMQLGQEFSKLLREKDLVLLEGNLGGGKTTFVKGVLKGLGYKKEVLSPTFTLVREYPTKKFMVYHIDLYRLEDKSAITDLGLEEYFYRPDSITFIEWGQKIELALSCYIKLVFNYLGQDSRDIKVYFKQRRSQ